METHRVHRLMFYNLEPKAITSLCYNNAKKLLAVLRNDNRIEIWNLKAAPFIQHTILLKPQSKIKEIVWCNKRIFGADLEGFVKEYDLLTLQEKNSYPVSSGGPCHSVAVSRSNKLLAVGTENGYINIYEVGEDNLSFNKFIQTTKRRILSICWDINSKYIVTSGIEAINVYDYESGNHINNMKPFKFHKRQKLCVWSITVTDDFTIIAGDSSGSLSFWDGTKGVCLDSFKSHISDILTVCLSKDQNTVYCAGFDPNINIFNKIKMRDGSVKWIKSREIINHSHDVNSLVTLNNGLLCSGGVDSYLTISKAYPYSVKLYPPLLQNPSVRKAVGPRYILLRYPKHLELWHLKAVSGDMLFQSDPFIKLLEIRSKNNELIRCADISNDGNFISYATNDTARIFNFSFDGDSPFLQPLSLSACSLKSVYNIHFSHDSKHLIVSDNTSCIQVFSISSEPELTLLYTINKGDDSVIRLLVTSFNNEYIAYAGKNGEVHVWKKSKFYLSLPKYKFPATAISFHPQDNILYVIYSDYWFIEYSLDKMHYTPFSKSFDSRLLVKYLEGNNLPVDNISFDFDKSSVIILNTSSTICVFDKNQVLIPEPKLKKIKLDPEIAESEIINKKSQNKDNQRSTRVINLKSYYEKDLIKRSEVDLAKDNSFHVYEKYQHLVHFESFGSKEMIAVEIKPIKFLEKLPPLLKKKQFGRK